MDDFGFCSTTMIYKLCMVHLDVREPSLTRLLAHRQTGSDVIGIWLDVSCRGLVKLTRELWPQRLDPVSRSNVC